MAYPIPSYLASSYPSLLNLQVLRSFNTPVSIAGESDTQRMVLEVWHLCLLVRTTVKLGNHSEEWYVSNFLQVCPCAIQPSNSGLDSK